MWRRRKLIWAFAGLVLAVGLFGGWQSWRGQSRIDSMTHLREAGYQVRETSTRLPRLPFTSLRITVPSSERLRIFQTIFQKPDRLEAADIPHLKKLSADVESFSCPLLKVRDEDVQVLAQMQGLERLAIDGSELTDAGAADLRTLRHLRDIEIYAPHVTDDGFKWLANCSNLSFLDILDSQISDKCIERITHLRKTRRIRISNTNVTSEVISHCGQFDELYALDLSGTRIDNDCEFHLAKVKNVQNLDLSRTRVGDPICKGLAQMPVLKSLRLIDTELTDSGVRYILTHCRLLEKLSLRSCKMTSAAFDVPEWPTQLKELDLKFTGLSGQEIVEIYSNHESLESIGVVLDNFDRDSRRQYLELQNKRRPSIARR